MSGRGKGGKAKAKSKTRSDHSGQDFSFQSAKFTDFFARDTMQTELDPERQFT